MNFCYYHGLCKGEIKSIYREFDADTGLVNGVSCFGVIVCTVEGCGISGIMNMADYYRLVGEHLEPEAKKVVDFIVKDRWQE